MPGANVSQPWPLQRLNPFYPGQPGVEGTDNRTGLRQSVEGTIFYVDPNYAGATTTADGTNPTNPLSTVAAALTKCADHRGDMIVVMANGAWTHGEGTTRALPVQESVTVTVHGVKIVGMAPSSSVGVVWEPSVSGATAITVHALDVLIEGFAFQGDFDPAISAEWNGTALYGDNLTVRNCLFDEDVDIAIQLEFSWFFDIHHNGFFSCDEYGIYADAGGSGADDGYIHHNNFWNIGTSAVALLGGSADNKVWENQFWNTHAAIGPAGGATTGEMIDMTGGAREFVHDNIMSCLDTVPQNGDYADCNVSTASGAWCRNRLMDAFSSTNP